MFRGFKVDTSSSLWRTTIRRVLNKFRGVRSFRFNDYIGYGIVEVLGNFDPQKLVIKLLAEEDIEAIKLGHPCDDLGYNHWVGHRCGGVCGYCCNGDSNTPPGPFAELAREFLGPPLVFGQTAHNLHVKRSVGCFNFW